MSAFLTPDLKPFYGGTYFPPQDRYGMPSFKKVLRGIIEAWQNRRDEIHNTAEKLSQSIQSYFGQSPQSMPNALSNPKNYQDLVINFVARTERFYDSVNGGFGQAPKFFHTE